MGFGTRGVAITALSEGEGNMRGRAPGREKARTAAAGGTPTGSTRSAEGKTVVGTAQSRIGSGGSGANAPTPPNALGSDSAAAANLAAIRARRRGAGSSVLSRLGPGTGAPTAVLNTRKLSGA